MIKLNKKISVGAVCVVVSLAALSVLVPAFYISNQNYDAKVNKQLVLTLTATSTETDVAAISVGPYIVAKGERFNAIVAETLAERQQGLSGKTGLGPREAMLFVFDTDNRHGFWMKDMLFSIDIVWLDSAYKVVHIKSNASPKSYPTAFLPNTNSRYVVEFAAGTVAKLGLQEGDIFSIFQ